MAFQIAQPYDSQPEQPDIVGSMAKGVNLRGMMQAQQQQAALAPGQQVLQQQEIASNAQVAQQNQIKLQKQQQDAQDQKTIQQAAAAHGGSVLDALPELQGKISQETYDGLVDHIDKKKSEYAAYKKVDLDNEKSSSDNMLGLIQQASQLPPDQYQAMYPQIIARAIEIDPKIKDKIDPAKPVPQDQLSHLSMGLVLKSQLAAQSLEKRQEAAASLAQQRQEAADRLAQRNADERGRHNKAMENKPTGASGSTSSSDVNDVIDAIHEGEASPVLTEYSFRDRTKIAAGLHRQGFDVAKAGQDYKATQKYLSTLNGAQQLRLRQAVSFADESLPQVEQAYDRWSKLARAQSGFKSINKAALAASAQLPGEAGSAATQLQALIKDYTNELGTVYKGGNSSTDESLKLAAENLKGEWNEQTFKDAISRIKQSIKYRKNSIKQGAPEGVSEGSPYVGNIDRGQQGSSKPSGATHTGIGSVDKKKHWLDKNNNDLGVAE